MFLYKCFDTFGLFLNARWAIFFLFIQQPLRNKRKLHPKIGNFKVTHTSKHTHTVVYQTFRENKMSYLLILILRSASRPFQRSRFSSQGKKKESQTLLLFTFGCSGTCWVGPREGSGSKVNPNLVSFHPSSGFHTSLLQTTGSKVAKHLNIQSCYLKIRR